MNKRTEQPDTPATPKPTPQPIAPHVIDPQAVYTLDSASRALGLKRGCLPREIRLGRLRAAKRAGKVMLLGEWLLGWIRAGEVRRERKPTSANGFHSADI
jgi:hypothetical protein